MLLRVKDNLGLLQVVFFRADQIIENVVFIFCHLYIRKFFEDRPLEIKHFTKHCFFSLSKFFLEPGNSLLNITNEIANLFVTSNLRAGVREQIPASEQFILGALEKAIATHFLEDGLAGLIQDDLVFVVVEDDK